MIKTKKTKGKDKKKNETNDNKTIVDLTADNTTDSPVKPVLGRKRRSIDDDDNTNANANVDANDDNNKTKKKK